MAIQDNHPAKECERPPQNRQLNLRSISSLLMEVSLIYPTSESASVPPVHVSKRIWGQPPSLRGHDILHSALLQRVRGTLRYVSQNKNKVSAQLLAVLSPPWMPQIENRVRGAGATSLAAPVPRWYALTRWKLLGARRQLYWRVFWRC